MERVELLNEITRLSHKFGSEDYVRGGGGNTSVKNSKTIWIKPSGTVLSQLKPDDFVALDRAKLGALYNADVPENPDDRESLVKDILMQSVLPDSKGRPSVESPLHDSLESRFVVHTHPTRVNGLTCSKQGKTAAKQLFPQALWVEYIDPGFTLCMQIRKHLQQYQNQYGKQPGIILLENHGIFVCSDQPNRIEQIYQEVVSSLQAIYSKSSPPIELINPKPLPQNRLDKVKKTLQKILSPQRSTHVVGVERFDAALGPISPDHIVYSKSYLFIGEPTATGIKDFVQKWGYEPAVIVWDDGVYGLGATLKQAQLALEFAIDGAQVIEYAKCFGGIQYLTDKARMFIENWEVENYRIKQI